VTSSDQPAERTSNDGRATRRRYDRRARSYDAAEWLPERLAFGRLRRRLWGAVEGARCLEIGVGTGKNLPFHPEGARVVALDISRPMLTRAARAARRRSHEVDFVQADATRMPFRPGVFDAAAASFVFCSVPDPVAGFGEVKRVLAPGGRLHLAEHVRSPWRPLGWLMDRVNPLVVRVSGANINRDTRANLSRAGFELDVDERRMGGILLLMRGRPAAGGDTPAA
jgi:phosphatidylethanolamine/phosphatidyl-N-methylethanolamine N-methyltransferase